MTKTSTKLDIEMAEVRKDVEYIKESISEIKSSSENRDKKFDAFIQEFREHAKQERELMLQEFDKQDAKNEAKFADKKIEKAAYWVLGIVASILITAFMYLLLK